MSSLSLPRTEALPRLSGWPLNLARLVWLLVCGSAVLLFLYAVPYRYTALANPSSLTNSHLAALGLAPAFYGAYSLFWELVIAVPSVIVGFIIFWRCGEQRIALLTALMLIIFGVGSGTLTPTIRALIGLHPVLDFLQHLYQFIAWYSLSLFFYLFPTGRFVPGWTRWAAVAMFAISTAWNFFPTSRLAPPNWPTALFIVYIVFQYGSWIVSQAYRYRRVSNAVERQQTKWVVFALACFTLLIVVSSLVSLLIPGYDLLGEEQPNPEAFAFMLGSWLLSPVMVLLPLALLFSIMRYRLWDIDLVVNRAIVYGVLTLSTMALYIGVVGLLGNFMQGQTRSLAAFGTTGLVAVIFRPLHDRIQRAVNRLMYGDRDEPYTALARLRQRLELAVAPETILPAIAETAAQSLKLPYAAVRLAGEVVAASGSLPAQASVESFPMAHQGEVIGALEVTPRAAGESLAATERRLLADMAYQAGIVAHNLRLAQELQHARERLVTAREEERRRLRRDLHDGLGPKMAGQALILEAVRDSLEAQAESRALLDHLIQDSQSVVTEIRQLVHGLRPPALDDFGLAGALRALAAQCEVGELRIEIETPDNLPALPAAVEVAVYRIVQEALTNVVKHAQARTCRVALRLEERLQIEVADDGVGLQPTRQAGVGSASMRERAEEIGGSLVIQANPAGGTRLLASLPLCL